MSDAAIAARLIEALNAAATREAGEGAALVSVEVTMLARADAARVEARVTRKTKTLMFVAADCFDGASVHIAAAASVYKLAGGGG